MEEAGEGGCVPGMASACVWGSSNPSTESCPDTSESLMAEGPMESAKQTEPNGRGHVLASTAKQIMRE